MQNLEGKPLLAGISDIRKNAEWRLTRLGMQTAHELGNFRKGIEWRLVRFNTEWVQRLALLHRRALRRTAFIGITGSAGKSTTKDLVAGILERHLPRGRKGYGTLNGPTDAARLVLKTRPWDSYCVTEIAISNEAGIDLPLALFRPTVGVVTNVGGDHYSAYGSLDGIAAEKSKLVKSLPPDGIAILNADDSRVLAMQAHFPGRTVTYGLGDGAAVRGEAVESSWPERLSFTVTWNGQSVRVQTQLCGSHWVPAVLAALATGVALGVPLTVAAEAVAGVEPFEARMSPVPCNDGVTFIRDDWKAPFWTIAPTLDFMRQARAARKIVVIGTISDYAGDSTRRYVEIARQALAVSSCVLFVGPRASAALRAKRDASDPLFAFPSLKDASAYLSGYLRPGDLVLLKGSTRTDHLERLILARTGSVECWRSGCGRWCYCNECTLVHVPSEPDGTKPAASAALEPVASETAPSASDRPAAVVIGLGNPGDKYHDTPHNVGYRVVDILAQHLAGTWTREADVALVIRARWQGLPVCLIKLMSPVNGVGAPLARLAQQFGFGAQDCIVVHDDLDLPMGTLRTRMRGGAGGHRGIQSIVQAFQDDRFRRVKIGVGKPRAGESIVDYVLSPFPPEQVAAIGTASRAAADRVMELLRQSAPSRSSSMDEDAEEAPAC